MNKKNLLKLLLIPAFLPAIALADVPGGGGYGTDVSNLQTLIGRFASDVLWVIFTGIVVICFVYSGILFLTAAGEADKLKKARSSFLWGIAGVIIGILAYSILNIVGNIIG